MTHTQRRSLLEAIAILRSNRDYLTVRGAELKETLSMGSFERGMAAGFHLSAHVLWRQYKEA